MPETTRSATATRAPSERNWRTIAAPIPPAAPVTSAVFSANLPVGSPAFMIDLVLVVEHIDSRYFPLASGNEVAQCLVDGLVKLRLLVGLQDLARLDERPGRRVLRPVGNPLFDGIVVEQLRYEESALKVRLRVRVAKIVAARSDVAHSRQRLVEIVPADAFRHAVPHGALLGINDEFRNRAVQTALVPAGRVPEIVRPREQHSHHRGGAFIACLGIEDLRTAKRV